MSSEKGGPFKETVTSTYDSSAVTSSFTPPSPYEVAMPNAVDVERALLGAILCNSSTFLDLQEIVSEDMFYAPKHRSIFNAMVGVSQHGEQVDPISVRTQLDNRDALVMLGGDEYLSELVRQAPITGKLDGYARIIRDKFLRRRLINAAGVIADTARKQERVLDAVIDEAEKCLFEVTQSSSFAQSYHSLEKDLPELVESIVSLAQHSGKQRGIPSGFRSLDRMLAGFQRSDLIILAARPSMGKTSLALDIARKTATNHNVPVGIFSLEMSSTQLIERMVASESMLHAWKMRTGNLHDSDSFQRLTDATDRLSRAPIYIDDRPGINTINIRSTARKMKREQDIQLIVVDYLQLISPHETRKSDSLVQQVTEVSRTLKLIARELNVPVLALSQLSREIEKQNRKPRLSDLRDSGTIEQDADVVMFIHRGESQYEGDERAPVQMEILVEKHRNGPVGRVELMFDKTHVTFTEPAREEYSAVGSAETKLGDAQEEHYHNDFNEPPSEEHT